MRGRAGYRPLVLVRRGTHSFEVFAVWLGSYLDTDRGSPAGDSGNLQQIGHQPTRTGSAEVSVRLGVATNGKVCHKKRD